MLELAHFKPVREKIDELFLREVVPGCSVLVTEASEHEVAAIFQDAVDALNERGSVSDRHVMEAAHVENQIERSITKGEFKEILDSEVYLDVCLFGFFLRVFNGCW